MSNELIRPACCKQPNLKRGKILVQGTHNGAKFPIPDVAATWCERCGRWLPDPDVAEIRLVDKNTGVETFHPLASLKPQRVKYI